MPILDSSPTLQRSMNVTVLNYKPKWYHLGDPDNIPLALAYGALALSKIFLVEYILAGVLFSNADGVLISDAAAHIAFSNSSWLEVCRWVLLARPGKKAERRVCKRAVIALLLRVVVLLIDLAILGLSLPHPIVVYEENVGSSIMAFPDDPPAYSTSVIQSGLRGFLCYGAYNSENPLYSDCEEFTDWKVGGSMGYYHQYNNPRSST